MIDPRARRECSVEVIDVQVAPPSDGADAAMLRVSGWWTRGRPSGPTAPVLVVGTERFESLSGFEERGDDTPPRWQATFTVPERLRSALSEPTVLEIGNAGIGLPPMPVVPPEPADEEAAGAEPEDLAEHRARRAEVAEQAQARRAAEAEQTLSALEAERARLELGLEQAAKDRAALEDELAERERELRAARQRAYAEQRLRQEAGDEGTRRADSAQEEVLDVRRRLDRAERRARESASELEGLRRRAAEAQQQVATADAARRAAETRVAELEAAAERGMDGVREAGEQVAEARGQVADAIETAQAVQAEVAEGTSAQSRIESERVVAELMSWLERERERDRATFERERAEFERKLVQVTDRGLSEQAERAQKLEAELEERTVMQRQIEGALEGLRHQLGAVVADEERTRATGGAVLELVGQASEALAEAELRIGEVQIAGREVQAELERERLERAAIEAALREAAERRRLAFEGQIAELRDRMEALEREELTATEKGPAEPAEQKVEDLLSGLRERLAALEERAEAEMGPEAMGPPPAEPEPAEPDTVAPPAEEPEAAEPSAPAARLGRGVAVGAARTGSWVAPALSALALTDAATAAQLAVELAPVQASAQGLEFDADIVLLGVGAWRVAAGSEGSASARLSALRPRREVDFRLTAEPAAFVEFVTGRRRVRGKPKIRVQGGRRAGRRLRGLAGAPVGLAEALKAGAPVDVELAWAAVATAIDAGWTAGERFTVAHEPTDTPPFYVHVDDGRPVTVDDDPGPEPPAATVKGSHRALLALLAVEAPAEGDKASIAGDLEALRALERWAARAQNPATASD